MVASRATDISLELSPLVSVVIPTHGRADLLRKAIESVLRQQGGRLDAADAVEIIVVDDASRDSTPSVLAEYGSAVRVLRHETSRERGASRNAGAALAGARWIAFLDSDDEWEDDKLAAQFAAVGSANACVTQSWLIDERGAPLGLDDRAVGLSDADIDIVNPYRAVPSSLLIDRRFFLEIGGFPEERDVQGSEDWLFMAKLIAAECRPVVVPRPLVRYRVHSGNSTARPEAYLKSGLAAVGWLEEHGLVRAERGDLARAQKYESAAHAYALHGEIRTAGRCLRSAWACVDARTALALTRTTAQRAARAAVRRVPRPSLEPVSTQ